jgi:hypothetical protein
MAACRARSVPLDGRWIAVATALTLAVLHSPVHAATYKWVDEKGVVHYTDKIPTEAVNKGSTMLDKQARPVRRIDPAMTPEQRAAREAEEENRRLAAKAQEEIARRDRALVSSYTTESEIDLARSRALGTIDAQMDSSQAYTQQLRKNRQELELRKAKVGNGPLPPALERELEVNEAEMQKTAALIELKQRERAAVVARYDADKARWRELKAISDANAAAAANVPRTYPGAVSTGGSSGSIAAPVTPTSSPRK